MASQFDILFHWKAPTSDTAQRVIIASIAAISIHGLCFYVFQVQDPQAPRTVRQTFEVTYLSPHDPAARPILQQIDDYYSAFDGTLLADSELSMPLPSLDYVPSYEVQDAELMALPEAEPAPLEALGPQVSPMVFPSMPPYEPAAPGAEGVVVTLTESLRLELPEKMAARFLGPGAADWKEVARQVGWAAGTGGRQAWALRVGSDGRVTEARALGGALASGLEEAVKGLTFAPAEGEESVWIDVAFLW